MIRWYVDKKNRMPLYLQLKDLILYYINTGEIQDQQKLPPIRDLAKNLGLNYETVRRAFIELEKEGLISMNQGKGTTVTLFRQNETKTIVSLDTKAQEDLESALKNLFKSGMAEDDVRRILDRIVRKVRLESPKKFIIFSECNQYQLQNVSQTLREYLKIEVMPVLVQNCERTVRQVIDSEEGKLVGIITTPSHIYAIREAVRNIPVYVDSIHTRMSTDSRQKINSFIQKKARIGLMSRKNFLFVFSVFIKAELETESDFPSCAFEEKSKIEHFLKSLDVLLVPPSLYEEIKNVAPLELTVFNFMDQVDPLSLEIVKQRISQLS